MAYIEKRKNGYRAQVRRRGMPSISRTFDLLSDAESWAREIEREAQRGNTAALRNDAARVTVKELADRYEETVTAMRSYRSLRVYIAGVRERFGPLFLANVRAIDVAAWRDSLLSSGLSASSVKHYLQAASAMFRYAENELSIHLPAGNPVRGVKKPSEAGCARDRRLKPGEWDYLMRATVPGARLRVSREIRPILVLAVETSMRLGELLSLRWEHIDLARRTAHLPRTKNGSSRTVALSGSALSALQGMPRRIDGKVFSWKNTNNFEPVWKSCRARARRLYEADCAAQGTRPAPGFLADLRFHDLRHEATSRLFEKGLGIMEVASMTGHKSLAMLKRYTHVEAEKLAKKLG